MKNFIFSSVFFGVIIWAANGQGGWQSIPIGVAGDNYIIAPLPIAYKGENFPPMEQTSEGWINVQTWGIYTPDYYKGTKAQWLVPMNSNFIIQNN